MKCPFCGAWTEVVHTKTGDVVVRRRKCAGKFGHQHDFKTQEVYLPAKAQPAINLLGYRSKGSWPNMARDLQLWDEWSLHGLTHEQVAQRFGVSRSRATKIIKRAEQYYKDRDPTV